MNEAGATHRSRKQRSDVATRSAKSSTKSDTLVCVGAKTLTQYTADVPNNAFHHARSCVAPHVSRIEVVQLARQQVRVGMGDRVVKSLHDGPKIILAAMVNGYNNSGLVHTGAHFRGASCVISSVVRVSGMLFLVGMRLFVCACRRVIHSTWHAPALVQVSATCTQHFFNGAYSWNQCAKSATLKTATIDTLEIGSRQGHLNKREKMASKTAQALSPSYKLGT